MVKRKVVWSPEAKIDLIDILEFYFVQNGTKTYSHKLNSKINKNIRLLLKNPFIGVQTDYDSVRVLITGDYQIIYEIFDQIVLIIMIWDCRRDPGNKRIEERVM
jgi:plasmid stabilization system protein ParE